VLTPSRLDPLATGAFIALAARGATGLEPSVARAKFVLLGAIGSFVAIGIVGGGFDPFALVMQVAGYTILALLFGSLLVLTLAAPPHARWHRLLSSRFLVAFGTYSYALYLFHLPLRAILRDWIYRPEQFLTVMGSTLPGQLLFYVAATSIAFLAAWLSWHVYERHFLALKDYFAPSPTRTRKEHIGWLGISRLTGVFMPGKRTET
jgi:peptidoglycan/LPS O-acetylase OafA/YrhL